MDFQILCPRERLVEKFAAALDDMRWSGTPEGKLFHYSTILNRAFCCMTADVGRNYDGVAMIDDMVGQFPDLMFHGGGYADPTWQTWWFHGHNGETTWRCELVSEDELEIDPVKDKEAYERLIVESRKRLSYCQIQLDQLESSLQHNERIAQTQLDDAIRQMGE